MLVPTVLPPAQPLAGPASIQEAAPEGSLLHTEFFMLPLYLGPTVYGNDGVIVEMESTVMW